MVVVALPKVQQHTRYLLICQPSGNGTRSTPREGKKAQQRRHRKDRQLLVQVAKDVVHLDREWHRRGVVVMVRQQEPQLRRQQ